jgi:dienelactone hydrolase
VAAKASGKGKGGKPKELFAELSRPGPHRVLRGELALVGLPGLVFTPAAGLGLPAVAFGHGWLQPASRYQGLMRHLASWGIVVATPGTQRGPLASHRLYAQDLRTALDVCVGVRLGEGEISVDEGKLGLAGHSTGGGSAVLAAAEDERVRAVGTVSVAETHPPASEAAQRCAMPGLHLAGGRDLIAPAPAHAEVIAQPWAGPVILRTLPKASHLGVTDGRHWSELLLHGKAEYATRRTAKTLLAAFFLVHLAGQEQWRPLLDGKLKGAEVDYQHEQSDLAKAAGRLG